MPSCLVLFGGGGGVGMEVGRKKGSCSLWGPAEAGFELLIFLTLLPCAGVIEMNHHARFYEELGLSPGHFFCAF